MFTLLGLSKFGRLFLCVTICLSFYFYAISPTDSIYSFSHRKENHNLEGYGYARYTDDNIVLGAGFRKNIPIDSQDNYFSYQGNIRYNFSSKSSTLLSAGRYNGYTVPAYYIQRFAQISSVQYAVEYNYERVYRLN